ncbi:amino acid ABC transporter permease [Marinactinospora rubrisoli]|uniref:Amino acid ABC transporter permease n=1 Tax=Marinactinospora rubrisoli TaxID=2715399 RepID=A0ABW2KHY5_9ACTN
MNVVLENLGPIGEAFWSTVLLSVASGIGALLLGTVLAGMRVSPVPVLRASGTLYVNTMRNTPLTLVLLFCGLGLGNTLGLKFSDTVTVNSYWLAVVGLSAYTASFVCESLRAGINTVPMGQAEAARSIGLTFGQTLTSIILPQAFRSVVGPLGSVFIALIKNTTIASLIGVAEAAASMRTLIEFNGNAVIPIFLGFALGFMVLTLPTGFFFGWLSKRLAVAR